MPFNNETGDTTSRTIPAGCTCETCKLARFEGSAIRNAVVHAYSYRPRQWRMNKVANDPYDYFLGVELETDNYKTDPASGGRIRSQFTNEQAADMRRPKNLWMAKRDGSVSGPEFVSHPATLAYWQKNKAGLAAMFQMLVHAGFRSHDNDHAGMHINISKNAFSDSRHLYRFLSLIHGNAAWSLKMSQRTNSSAEQWASLSYLADETRRQTEVDRIMPDSNATYAPWNRGSSHRYQALNCPSGQSRFEFRLPRGTLRLDRFMKNLEWTVAMIEYSRTHSLAQMKSLDFMRWANLGPQAEKFPNLVAFLGERFPTTVLSTTTVVAEASLNVNADGVRISPRTGRPVRSYNRRPGARRPGRPTGFSPRARRVAEIGYECGRRGVEGFYCEYTAGHSGAHGAPSIRRPDFAGLAYNY